MGWVHTVALVSLLLAAGCTLVIVIDIVVHPQRMWVMNIVWPLTALYAGPLALWAYCRIGLPSTRENAKKTQERGEKMSTKKKPFWQSAAVATTHCGSGCALGAIIRTIAGNSCLRLNEESQSLLSRFTN